MSEAEFNRLRKLVHSLTGIKLPDTNRLMLQRRLTKRLQARGMNSFEQYFEYVHRQDDPEEIELFSNAVTTNLTAFYREKHHFEYLADVILPYLVKKARNEPSRRLRIWSAGCSTGEEAYSIAMTLKESLPDLTRWDAKILATDLDSGVLEKCRQGVYSASNTGHLTEERIGKWFRPTDPSGDFIEAKPELRRLITFKQLNLMHEWPVKGPFDVIFCRNVLIYFAKETQKFLVDRFKQVLADDGRLILGHSESLFNVTKSFDLIKQTIYKKVGA